ncbi:Methyltransferase domain-containing protein [Pseudonocardia thermophila]|uniref:Methyltransferase domain-containing protein n=1 Tax=Pseudonocardia thermophila TaxID=1848 RepID=A0A1M6QBC6_PSETH|nr:class I SAM-dependent methyltransferase [Pseudonocardia thermophila]SHK17393.1 Methyltransferase domain-containing protein [Pseudonocardia thermophila]
MTRAKPVNPLVRFVKRTLRRAIANAAPGAESGVHIDPLTTPVDQLPPKLGTALHATPEMRTFRRVLQLDDRDVRESVLDDLATYYDISPEEARRRALHWEEESLKEWTAVDGSSSDEARVTFYRTQQSWSFDLLWWAYLQAEGYADPASVLAYRWLQQYSPGRRHLDFGSGVGVTSQLFIEGGWTSTLADLSSTLLDFAQFRLQRRGQKADFIDLAESGLPAGEFDAITAIDTLGHVPDLYATAVQLHAALARGGHLIANIDIREESAATVWHLHDDDLRAEYDLRRAGFVPVASLGYGLTAYRKAADGQARTLLRNTRDWLVLVSPPRRAARAITRPVLRILARRMGR